MGIELTPRSRTIDNLGIDSSVRYAKDQEYLDKNLIHESKFIPTQAQVSVSVPFFSSEFESIFQTTNRNKGWAAFLRPPGYTDQKNILFSFQILPSLGKEEGYFFEKQRIQDKIQKEKEKRKKQRDGQKNKQPFEEVIELKEEEKESDKLIRLLEIISNLDKILMDINARRNQYQRG